MSDKAPTASEVLVQVTALAKLLAWTHDDPAKIAEKVSRFLADRLPARTGTAYWVCMSGQKDKGLEVTVAERKIGLGVRLSFLLGKHTAGMAGLVDVCAKEVKPGTMLRCSAGIALVSPCERFGDSWDVAAVARVRF